MTIPLFDFDARREAVINPWTVPGVEGLPERAVACWFGDVVRERTAGTDPAYVISLEHQEQPVHVVEHRGHDVLLFNPGVGAPLAAAHFEVVIANGVRSVVGCGAAGIVVPGFDPGHVMVPTSAVRDEGTSYHYAPPETEVGPHPAALAAIDAVLSERGVPHDLVRTWTTDGFFRETPDKVARRREQGCVAVEMEAAAMFAVAAFRDVVYGQLLYAGDDVSAQQWDHRDWDRQTSARLHLLDLAFDAVLRI